ncbi:uncharacterized protein METZ01_LOCUS417829 [marine metagenome]|uniref:Ribosomal silencing factor RsfS n=1 Tax=marine metagenome TaxID=408172 RepID=A0A382X2Z2_9ZZZZ
MRIEGNEKISPLAHAVHLAGTLALERKASDVVALDLRAVSGATDCFLLVTGQSDVQVKAIAEHIIDELKKETVRPEHIEGMKGGRWVLLDYIDFVVHVFHHGAREFYQLDLLWGDVPRWEFDEGGVE